MKKEDAEELRAIATRLYAKGTDFRSSYSPAIARYKELAERNQHTPALNDALLEQSSLLISQGRYFEAIQVHEERLKKNPNDLAAQANIRRVLNEVHSGLRKLAQTNPENAEYGRTYEKLLQLGFSGLEVHLGAVRHYLASGQIDRAVERVIKLARVAPNLNGVANVIIRLANVSDDLELVKMNEQLKRGGQ